MLAEVEEAAGGVPADDVVVAHVPATREDLQLGLQIYNLLAAKVDDVNLVDIEAELGFSWAPKPLDNCRSVDYLQSLAIERMVYSSTRELLFDVQQLCDLLPGLDAVEMTSRASSKVVAKAHRTLLNAIAGLLTSRTLKDDGGGAFLLGVKTACRRVFDEAVHSARERMVLQEFGVVALQKLCSSEELDMQQDFLDSLTMLVRDPPESLVAEMSRRRVSLFELGWILAPPTGAAPMSGALKETRLCSWVATWGDAAGAASACALNEMRQKHVRLGSTENPSWCGLSVHKSTDSRVAALVGAGRGAVACPVPNHTRGRLSLFIVQTSSDSCALRAVRLAAVIYEMALAGALRPRRIRADWLLPLVGHWVDATNLELESLVGNDEPPQPQQPQPHQPPRAFGVPGGGGAINHEPHSYNELLLAAHSVPSCLTQHFFFAIVVKDLVRDPTRDATDRFFFGSSLLYENLVRFGKDREDDATLAGVLRYGCESRRASSLKQSASKFLMKISQNIIGWWDKQPACLDRPLCSLDCVFEKLPKTSISERAGISVSKSGLSALSLYTEYLIQSMRPPFAANFLKDWHVSRSARSRAAQRLGLRPTWPPANLASGQVK